MYRLITSCIASTDTSSLATRHTSPPDSTNSTFMTMSPSRLSYHLETSNAKTLMPSFLSYILSEFSGPSFISLLIEAYLRVGISKEISSPMKSGSPCFTSQLVGTSLRSAGWHLAQSILRRLMIVFYLGALVQSTNGWFLRYLRCAKGRHPSPCLRLGR